jgi:lipopolysaccharide heptosyltransferase II
LRELLRIVDRKLGNLLILLLLAYDSLLDHFRPGRDGKRVGPGGVDSFLVIKLIGLGDTVLMLTPLAELRRRMPGARIVALVTPLSRGILAEQPFVDEVIVYDVFGKDRGIGGFLRVLTRLRGESFGCTIDFEQHFRLTAVLGYLVGSPVRIGLQLGKNVRGRLFTHPVRIDTAAHMVDTFMGLLRPLGIEPGRVESLEPIRVPVEAGRRAKEFLRESGMLSRRPLVGMHTGCGVRTSARRWAPDRFAELIRRLVKSYGAGVVLTGTHGERELVDTILAMAGAGDAVNAAGRFSILETAALIAECDLFISNDTGPMHVAAAVGTPTIGIFGPESPDRYGPVGSRNRAVYRGAECSPCVRIYRGIAPHCAHARCTRSIGIEEVWHEVEDCHLEVTGA